MNDDYVGDDKVLTKEVLFTSQLISNGGLQYFKKQYMLVSIPTAASTSTAAAASATATTTATATATTATKKIQVPHKKKNLNKVWLDNDDANIGRNP